MKKMEINKLISAYNVMVGAGVALLSSVFGAFWYLFASYFILNIMDWVTGWYKARKLKMESSEKGLAGIIKKTGYWVMIAVAFIVSRVFTAVGYDLIGVDLSFLNMIGWFTLSMLIVNECRSILENLVECNIYVPQILIKGLAVTQKLIDAKANDGDNDGDME